MNTSLTAYTPLETLLLFQSLKTYGLGPAVFSRISDLLKKNPHVRGAKQYDGGRLTPDALQDLYNRLVKDEVTSESRNGSPTEQDGPNGDIHNNPRKRKAPTPTLPSVQDAAQNAYLIPKLVEKLYARYRAQVTEEIREEEKQIARLQHELQQIEQGEWDERLLGPDLANGHSQNALKGNKPSGSPAPLHSVQHDTNGPPTTTPIPASIATPKAAAPSPRSPQNVISPPHGKLSPETTLNNSAAPSQVSPPPPGPLSQPSLPPQQAVPPTIQQQQQQQQQQQPQLSPVRNHHPSSTPPSLPSAQPSRGHLISPPVHQSPYPPQQVSQPGPVVNARPAHPPIAGQPPGPADVQPSLSGAQHPPVVATPHLENGSRQTVVPPAAPGGSPLPQSPMPNPQAPFRDQSLPSSQPSPGQQPTSPAAQFPSSQTHTALYVPAPPTPQLTGAPGPQRQGGYMLAPFQLYDTPPPLQQQQQKQQKQQPPPPQHPLVSQPSTPTPGKARTQRGPRNVKVPPRASSTTTVPSGASAVLPANQLSEVLQLLSTPAARPRRSVSTALSINTTPSSEVRWKASLPPYQGPPVPSPSASPIEEIAPALPLPDSKTGSASASRSRRQGKDALTVHSEDNASEEGSRTTQTGRRQTRRTRGVSVTSSAVDGSIRGRTRSQSITSHADGMSVDNDSAPPRSFKPEPSPSADTLEEVLPGIESTPAAVLASRRLRGNVAQTGTATKRKREARDTSEVAESLGTPGPQHVIAPRHFSKMCQPLMNDVTSHKHASLFSMPVKEKDAEGYRDIIRRPQDLKSIKTAINVGAKVVAAAASADTPGGPNSPGGGGGNVILPLSVDAVPPKAIVNSSQLEKELMRMFANAVMFNSGEEEGVVQDAREMFEDVQGAVSNWRSAERTADGRDRGTESDAVGDDETAGLPKRRKL